MRDSEGSPKPWISIYQNGLILHDLGVYFRKLTFVISGGPRLDGIRRGIYGG